MLDRRVKVAPAWYQKTIDEFHDKKGRDVGNWGDNLLLLTLKRARSGQSITLPIVTRRRGEAYVVVASAGGRPNNPQWYHNIKVNPDVEIEVPVPGGTDHLRAHARVAAEGPERDKLYAFMTEIWPSFSDYELRTERVIPVVVLDLVKSEPAA